MVDFSLNKPFVNFAEIAGDSIEIDIRYFGSDNFVGTRDSITDDSFFRKQFS